MTGLKINIKGRSVEVGVSETGVFGCEFQGDRLEAKTMEALRTQISRLIDKKPVAVPALLLEARYSGEPVKTRAVTLVGRHATNGNLLVKGARGTEQLGRFESSNLLRANADIAKLKRLRAASIAADKAYDKAVETMRFDVQAFLKKLMSDAD